MPLKWEKLGGKKEPEFNVKYLIANEKTQEWCEGWLEEINTTGAGKTYRFSIDTEGHGWDNATHFMIIEPPKIDPPKEQ